MQNITLQTPARPHDYQISIGTCILGKIAEYIDLTSYSQAFIVTDQNVAKHWLSAITGPLTIKNSYLIMPAGEQSKNIDTLQNIWQAMRQAGCDRKSLVIALGGGVVGDIAGFAASTYMRGVDCLQVPTSLLAQVDSSVGGKTAIDFDGVKNLVGTFNQPVAVIIDTQVLSTLPKREFISGFGEIIKHGLICDANYLKEVTAKKPHDFTPTELESIIAGSCRIKAAVVTEDEKESGLRKTLNFGHNIGHAVESLSLGTTKPLLHGEAISIGMAVEADISKSLGLLSNNEVETIKEALKAAGLPVTCPDFSPQEIIEQQRSDKKNSFGTTRFVLLTNIGKSVWDKQVDDQTITSAIANNRGGQ
jgi:3-dehydroquinate synthase